VGISHTIVEKLETIGSLSPPHYSQEPIVKVLKREEFVIPTKVGHAVKHQRYPVFSICCKNFWIPVCTGMTVFAIGSQEYIQLTFLPTHIYKKFIVILFLRNWLVTIDIYFQWFFQSYFRMLATVYSSLPEWDGDLARRLEITLTIMEKMS